MSCDRGPDGAITKEVGERQRKYVRTPPLLCVNVCVFVWCQMSWGGGLLRVSKSLDFHINLL